MILPFATTEFPSGSFYRQNSNENDNFNFKVDFISKKFMKLKSSEKVPVFKYEDNNDDFQKFDLESFSANRLYNNIIDQLNTKSIG